TGAARHYLADGGGSTPGDLDCRSVWRPDGSPQKICSGISGPWALTQKGPHGHVFSPRHGTARPFSWDESRRPPGPTQDPDLLTRYVRSRQHPSLAAAWRGARVRVSAVGDSADDRVSHDPCLP